MLWQLDWHLSSIAHVMSHFQREVGGQLRNLPFWPELHCNWSKKRQKWVVSNPQPLLLWPELRMPISYHKWVASFSTFPPKSPFWVRQLKRGACFVGALWNKLFSRCRRSTAPRLSCLLSFKRQILQNEKFPPNYSRTWWRELFVNYDFISWFNFVAFNIVYLSKLSQVVYRCLIYNLSKINKIWVDEDGRHPHGMPLEGQCLVSSTASFACFSFLWVFVHDFNFVSFLRSSINLSCLDEATIYI